MSQPRSIETRLRPLWGPIGAQSGPESAFRAIHPAKPSIRLRLIGTCPSSHARTIRISPGQRIAQISYTTTSPRQTQTYPPSGVTAGRNRRTCSRNHPNPQPNRPGASSASASHPSAGLRKRGPSQAQAAQARAFAAATADARPAPPASSNSRYVCVWRRWVATADYRSSL